MSGTANGVTTPVKKRKRRTKAEIREVERLRKARQRARAAADVLAGVQGVGKQQTANKRKQTETNGGPDAARLSPGLILADPLVIINESRVSKQLYEENLSIKSPTVKNQALRVASESVELLTGMVRGSVEAPPAVRRQAALDLLTISGVIVPAGQAQPVAASAKPINELTADELRQLLQQQRSTLEGLQKSISGQVVEGERVIHGEHEPQTRTVKGLTTD